MSESKRAIKILEVILRFLKETGDITLLGDISDNAQKQGVSPNPFRILIGTVLSARNRDELTTIAVKQLFDEGGFDTPEKIAGATLEVLEGLIKKSGFGITPKPPDKYLLFSLVRSDQISARIKEPCGYENEKVIL